MTIDLYVELRRVAESLERAGVSYALAGGVAVSVYTTPRATQDIDLVVTVKDIHRATDEIAALGFRRAGPPMQVAAGRLEIHRLVKFDGSDLLPIDLLVPVDTALVGVLEGRAQVEIEGHRVFVVSVAGLRTLKRLRGSAQDLADLEALGLESE